MTTYEFTKNTKVPLFVIYGKRFGNSFITSCKALEYFYKMIKLCSFFVLLCFLTQITENHGIFAWWWRAPGCISCFRQVTELYYKQLDTISPECASSSKYDAIAKLRSMSVFNVCTSQYKDEFDKKYRQLKDAATKTLQDFTDCFQKNGLKEEDANKLNDATDEFEKLIQDQCQDSNNPVNPPYLQDELKKFRDRYKTSIQKQGQLDTNSNDKSKESADKKNLADTPPKDTKSGEPSKTSPTTQPTKDSGQDATPQDQPINGSKDQFKAQSNGWSTDQSKAQTGPAADTESKFSDARSSFTSTTSSSAPQSMQSVNRYASPSNPFAYELKANWGDGNISQDEFQESDDW